MTAPPRRTLPGVAFQTLVAAIERACQQRPGVTVESPAYVPDDTGGRREHDVLITRIEPPHRILTSVECKDYGRKVGVPHVEAFAKKCERTGIHHGVMVSASGFTRSATKATTSMRIQCVELADAAEFDWMSGVQLSICKRTVHDVWFDVIAPRSMRLPFEWRDKDGQPLDEKALKDLATMVLNAFGNPAAGRNGPVEEYVIWPSPDVSVIDAAGQEFQPTQVEVGLIHELNCSPMPIQHHRYVGQGGVTEIAVGSTTEGKAAKFVARTVNGRPHVSFVADDPSDDGWRFRHIDSEGRISFEAAEWSDPGTARAPRKGSGR